MSAPATTATNKVKTLIGGHIEIGHVLGSGGFGKVYSGFDIKQKKYVAVKMIDKVLVKNNGIQAYVEREIDMMRKIKSPHVVRLLEAIETSKSYTLVLELAPNGELFDKIVDSERFDEKTARNYFQQLISAVHYCHNKNIVHRDLKAENLLLGENNILKVCDFGLSRYTKEKGRANDNEVLFTSLAGSIDYQAPEVLKEQGYEGSACDMWSCGCILFFMLCGYLPFTDRSDGLTRKRILSNQYNRRNKYLSAGAAELIEKLLERDPNKRYTTTDVINNPWFGVDLDPSLFPDKGNVSPGSPSTSGEFIQRVITPQDQPAALTTSPTLKVADDLHQAFTSCNITGDGFLNKEEVRDALIKLNGDKEVSDKEVTQFMDNFKLDKDGRITEEEFVVGWTKHQNELGKKYNLSRMANLFHYDLEKEFLAHVRVAFDAIDKNHTGVLTKESFMNLNIGMTKEDAQTLFDVVDKEKKGVSTLTFERFVLLCMSYDLLRNHPLLIRLRRLEDIFAITESHSVKSSMNTGYMVAGARDQIKAQLMMKEQQLETKFDPGDVNGFLYGTYSPSGKKILEVGIRLLPAVSGYTKVIAYRIRGKTTDFRDWLLTLRKTMKDELLKYEEDTAIKGEPELM